MAGATRRSAVCDEEPESPSGIAITSGSCCTNSDRVFRENTSSHRDHAHKWRSRRRTLTRKSSYQGLDRERRASFGSIIHKHERTLFLAHALLNLSRGVLSH